MNNYTFKPSYPFFHRSSQSFFFAGLILGLTGVILASSAQDESFIYIAFILMAFVSLYGFIFQHIILRDKRQRGLFLVVESNGFHAYAGRGKDFKAEWDEVEDFTVKNKRLLITMTSGETFNIGIKSYSRIDRLRIESLMYQAVTYSKIAVEQPEEVLVEA